MKKLINPVSVVVIIIYSLFIIAVTYQCSNKDSDLIEVKVPEKVGSFEDKTKPVLRDSLIFKYETIKNNLNEGNGINYADSLDYFKLIQDDANYKIALQKVKEEIVRINILIAKKNDIIKELSSIKNEVKINEDANVKITSRIEHTGDIFNFEQDYIIKESTILVEEKTRFLARFGVGMIVYQNNSDKSLKPQAIGSIKLSKHISILALYGEDNKGGGLIYNF